MSLHKTAIRIDTDAAKRAAAALGTTTLTDTVNEALRRFAQIRAAEELGALIAAGAVNRGVLENDDSEELAEATGVKASRRRR